MSESLASKPVPALVPGFAGEPYGAGTTSAQANHQVHFCASPAMIQQHGLALASRSFNSFPTMSSEQDLTISAVSPSQTMQSPVSDDSSVSPRPDDNLASSNNSLAGSPASFVKRRNPRQLEEASAAVHDAHKMAHAATAKSPQEHVKKEQKFDPHQWKPHQLALPHYCRVCSVLMSAFSNCVGCEVCKVVIHEHCTSKNLPCFGVEGVRPTTGKHHAWVDRSFFMHDCLHCTKQMHGMNARCIDCGFHAHRDCQSDIPANCFSLHEHDAKTGTDNPGKLKRSEGWTANHPVIIIPGLCSTALTCLKSAENPHWEGSRIWLSLTKLGANALKNSSWSSGTDAYGMKLREAMKSEAMLDEVASAQANEWLQHISVVDGHCDPEGIMVRPMKGLTAVDYLLPGALTNSSSYVFGPLIESLRYVGYNDGNLRAAPYDWRLPPQQLEQRDGFFTDLAKLVEESAEENDGQPCVLLAHSMGVCCAKYFLHWAEQNRGRPWIDRYIYSLCAAGGPFLGAHKSHRAACLGDNMGLAGFLSAAESRVLCRSMGSAGWLFPKGPLVQSDTFFVRSEGLVFITIAAATFPHVPHGEYYVTIKFGSEEQHSTALPAALHMTWNETYQFVASKHGMPAVGDVVQIHVKHHGINSSIVGSAFMQTDPSNRFFAETLSLKKGGEVHGKIQVSLAFVPAFAAPSDSSDGSSVFQLRALQSSISESSTLQPSASQSSISENSTLQPSDSQSSILHSSGSVHHVPLHPREFFEAAGAGHVWQSAETLYNNDPFVADNWSEPPPVNRIYAMYGVGLPTEAAFGWKSHNCIVDCSLYMRYELDHHFKLPNYWCHSGIAFETTKTYQTQMDTGDKVFISGDGTVPYASLRFPMTWKATHGTDVMCVELEGLEHREMLQEHAFHHALIEYLCTKGSPDS